MERLTKIQNFFNMDALYSKLCELEDIEEELNFDLSTLLKAFRNGIHYINEGKIEWAIPIRFVYNLCRVYAEEETYFELKDYGKTWALTKEEL